MTEQKHAWITDAEGTYARVEPGEVDAWKPRGWTETDAPVEVGERQVWLEHSEHHGKARFSQSAAAQWKALGWEPSAPPAPIDLTKDPQLTDQVEEPAASDAKPTKSTKAASGGSTKES